MKVLKIKTLILSDIYIHQTREGLKVQSFKDTIIIGAPENIFSFYSNANKSVQHKEESSFNCRVQLLTATINTLKQ